MVETARSRGQVPGAGTARRRDLSITPSWCCGYSCRAVRPSDPQVRSPGPPFPHPLRPHPSPR